MIAGPGARASCDSFQRERRPPPPLTRSFGDKGTSSAKRDDPPGIGCQEQESTNGRTVYETDVWHHSSLSRRVSFTVSHVQRSCHYLRPPQKSPTRHRKTSILTILSVYSSTITPVFKMRWFTRNNEPNVCLDLSVAYVFQLSRCTCMYMLQLVGGGTRFPDSSSG